MTRRINLSFFDGQGYVDMGDEDFQKAMDEIRFAGFNDDASVEDAPPASDSDNDVTEDAPAAEDAQPVEGKPAPSPEGQPSSDEGESQPESPAGIPQPLVEKYAPIIGALENDPQFRAAMADAIAARRSGNIPAAAPQPERQSPPEEDKEPVCGDDELLEDFEKRHAEWEKRQQDKKVREEVNRAFSERQAAFLREQAARRAQEVNSLLRADAEAPAVGEFFKSNPAPPRLAQLMNEDPDVFMYVYDGMRQIIGKGNYFADVLASRRGGVSAAQGRAASAPAAAVAGRRAAPDARTQVKSPPAPFTETGGVKRGGGDAGPDFLNMTDKEFALYMERIKMQGL
ncbi:MAG: hypothetical protein Q4D58_09770 [Synergistaceae bacterium]|nr:hypothetical protein [Synergistaceae bacterium]